MTPPSGKLNLLKRRSSITDEQIDKTVKRIQSSIKGMALSNAIIYSINMKFIMITLVIRLLLPLLAEENYFASTYKSLRTISEMTISFKEKNILEYIPKRSFYYEGLLILELDGKALVSDHLNVIPSLREEEVCRFEIEEKSYKVKLYYDCSSFYRLSNSLNMGISFFLIVLNIIFPLLLENDIQKIVLVPLELMLAIVNVMIENPFVEDSPTDIFAKIQIQIQEKNIKDESYKIEIVNLQYSLLKISKLFKIGFGQAGGHIVSRRMDTETMTVNWNLDGRKREALFSFWSIKNFDNYVSTLGGQVVPLINSIAENVHASVFIFDGSVIKNLGDSFMNVWVEEFINMHSSVDTRMKLGDKAVLSAIYFINKQAKSENNTVKFGFGFHSGYGLEGLIGSESKIEPGYLSCDVNTSARLQSATSIYGVDLLISDSVFKHLSVFMANLFRKIDVVTVKGSSHPVTLFALDINDVGLNCEERGQAKNIVDFYEKLKGDYKEEIKALGTKGTSYFMKIKKYKNMCFGAKHKKFLELFEAGLYKYIDGEWKEAYYLLEKASDVQKDNPSCVLMKYMKKYNLEAPEDWKGYRVLENK